MFLEYSNSVSSLTIPDDLTLPTNHIICKRCDSKFTYQNWCYDCEAQKFQENFPNWTSENESLDELIQYSQLSMIFKLLNRLILIHSKYVLFFVALSSYDNFYTATWLDGSRESWDNGSQQWVRTGPVKIILRELKYPTINKLKLYLELKNIIMLLWIYSKSNN